MGNVEYGKLADVVDSKSSACGKPNGVSMPSNFGPTECVPPFGNIRTASLGENDTVPLSENGQFIKYKEGAVDRMVTSLEVFDTPAFGRVIQLTLDGEKEIVIDTKGIPFVYNGKSVTQITDVSVPSPFGKLTVFRTEDSGGLTLSDQNGKIPHVNGSKVINWQQENYEDMSLWRITTEHTQFFMNDDRKVLTYNWHEIYTIDERGLRWFFRQSDWSTSSVKLDQIHLTTPVMN